MKTFNTFSFGCRVNQAEELEIKRKMLDFGFKIVKKNPDILIVNTCAVTDKAERETRQCIYRIKRQNPKAFLVATGCAVTHWQKNSPNKKLPIDLAVDNINKDFLVKLLINRLSNQPNRDRVGRRKSAATISLQSKFLSSGRYLIKIQDGCHRFCTFCIVPYLRGLPHSFTIKEILEKIRTLPPNIKEVVLTAINTEAFGQDTGENFTGLVNSILTKTSISRLSFGSIHPSTIDKTFLETYKRFSGDRLINYFHIPLQSGSDKILFLMKRGYKTEELREKLWQIKKICPHALIGTDIIVGFLDETDKDFIQTYRFLESSPINKFHIFRFSKKKLTAAYYLAKRLKEPDEAIKKKRSRLLIELSRQKYQKFQNSLVGKIFSCLILQIQKDDYQEGLLSNQTQVFIKTKKRLESGIKTVYIESIKNGRLLASLQ